MAAEMEKMAGQNPIFGSIFPFRRAISGWGHFPFSFHFPGFLLRGRFPFCWPLQSQFLKNARKDSRGSLNFGTFFFPLPITWKTPTLPEDIPRSERKWAFGSESPENGRFP